MNKQIGGLNMISGGNATVYISSMDKALKFYTETLDFTLQQRYGDDWAEIKARDGFVIGLHPSKVNRPHGTLGSIEIGLNVNDKLETVISALSLRGVEFKDSIEEEIDSPVRLAHFKDPDGNALYLCEVKK